MLSEIKQDKATYTIYLNNIKKYTQKKDEYTKMLIMAFLSWYNCEQFFTSVFYTFQL